MPLPFKIGSPPTVDFSDYKNSYQAVYNALVADGNITSDGSLVLGDANEYLSLKFTNQTLDGPFVKLYVHADKVGSPAFNVSCDLYPDNGSGDPDLNNKLATGTVVAASSFPTTARLVQFTFLVPYATALLTTYHVVFKASAAGSSSNNVRFYKDSGGAMQSATNVNTGVRAFGSGTWTFPGTVDVLRCVLMSEHANLWAVAVDKTNNKYRIYKSEDSGATWTEISSTSAFACASTGGYKTTQVVESVSTTAAYQPRLIVMQVGATDSVAFITHNITPAATTWGAGSSASGMVLNTDAVSNRPLHTGYRTDGAFWVAHQGSTETIMGAPRRRLKLRNLVSGAQADVAGSANSPIANTLPGTATHYDLRLAFMDMEDRFHVFYSTSDDNNIQHRVLNADNTFSTINQIGSTPAVCSNTSAYPIGLGCNYFKNNEWRIAIMYLDSTSGTIKVAHCKAADSATASSWTTEQISTDTPEVITSNLGFLSGDSQQSGQLIAVYVKSDDTIWRTQDQGNGNWTAPVQIRSGQSVQGISGFLTARNLNFMYLDTTPTPDELKFDRL